MLSRNSTKYLPSGPIELCEIIKFLLQEKQARNNCDRINGEIVAIVEISLE